MLRRGDYYYMVLAEGGTAGPPTSHMVIAARSKTIEGPWENSPVQPDHPHRGRPPSAGGRRDTRRSSKARAASGTPSTTRTRTASTTSAARRCSNRSSGPPTAGSRRAGADVARPIPMPARAGGAARPRALRRLLDEQDGRAVELLQRRPTSDKRSVPLRQRRAGAEGQGHDAARQFAALVRVRRPRLPGPGRDRHRSRRDGRPAASSTTAGSTRGSAYSDDELRHAPLRNRARQRRSRRASAARCTCASPTTATSSPSTTARTGRPGSASARGWRCRATTTTWRTTS